MTRSSQLAVVEGDRAIVVSDLLADSPRDLQQMIEEGQQDRHRIEEALSSVQAQDAWRPLSSFRYDSAVLRPPEIIAVGLNYAAHASELALDRGATPTVFSFWSSSLSGHETTTSWPKKLSEQVDYEAELGVIIGRSAKDVSTADALDYVFGYTIVNDITARNIQFAESQWIRCKSFDGFTPVGPVVVTADEVPDPQKLHIGTTLDGVTVQDASTADMVRSIPELISFLSESTTLLPGTLISTGTAGGAGYSRNPQLFLEDGSTVTVWIDGIGKLTTHCRTV